MDFQEIMESEVRREDIKPLASSDYSISDEGLNAILQKQLAEAFGSFSFQKAQRAPENHEVPAITNCEEAKPEYEFKLFNSASQGKGRESIPEHHKVILDTPEPENSHPGFIGPSRPDEFYFARPASKERRVELRQAAVTGEDIMHRATQKQPGLRLPWKVITVTVDFKCRKDLSTPVSAAKPDGRRRRPGKKRRLVYRQRSYKLKESQKRQAELQKDREAELREKKTRKNRQKKVRKKEKEKENKSAEGQLGNLGPEN